MRNFLLWLILQPVECSRAIMAHLSYKINKIIRDCVAFVVVGGNGVDNDTSGNNKTSFIQTEWKQFVGIKS